MERETSQRRQKGIVVGYCSCGAAYPSHVQRGGNRNARQKCQRVNRERLRDDQVVSQVLVQSLSSLQGGSDSRNLETTGKLCVLHQFATPSAVKKDINPSSKDKPIYVGVSPHSRRLENDAKEQKKKEGDGWNIEEKKGFKKEQKSEEKVTADVSQQNKCTRTIEDGLLLVVPTKIYGKEVKTLIDSGATRCFVTPSCVTKMGLKGLP